MIRSNNVIGRARKMIRPGLAFRGVADFVKNSWPSTIPF